MLANKPSLSLEDKQAIDIWERNIKLDDTNHYVLDVPFKGHQSKLPHNRDMAESRLDGLKRKLSRDKDMYAAYCDTMQSLLDKGYAEPIDTDNESEENCTCHTTLYFTRKSQEK